MTTYSENELIPYALHIIREYPDGIDTKNLLLKLREKMKPSGDDLEILANRTDDKFSQKVRNLNSYKTLEKKGYVNFILNKFYIKQEGLDFLNDLEKNPNHLEMKKNESINNFIKNINIEEISTIKILEEWDISTRTHNTLKENHIFTIKDLLDWSEKKLLSIPKFGKQGLDEIKNYLSYYNLDFGDKIPSTNSTTDKIDDKNLKIDEERKIINHKTLSINILTDWPLSVRTFNALKHENIIFLGDLLSYEESALIRLRNFGRKSLKEIKELYQRFNIDKDKHNYDLSGWIELRDQLIINQKKHKINQNKKNLIGLNKSIFKDFQKFKENFYKIEKIIIHKNIHTTELEKLILDDIEYIASLLTDKMLILFTGRYGYKEKYKTLEELGQKFGITRERVRQLEKNLNLSLIKLGKIEKNSLVQFFNKYEYVSFHKLFPTLDKNFTDTALGTGEITRDKLVIFMEYFCGVKEEYFKTPERELWHFDSSKLSEIFTFVPSGISLENFLEIIKDNYGYNDFVAKSSLGFMKNNNLIKIIDKKVYPLKLNKIYEIANILVSYPEGLHWKKVCEIGNNSYTKNKWNLERLVGDFSLTVKYNHFIYHSDRGTLKLIKFCNLLDDRNQVLEEILNIYNDNYRDQISLDFLFKEIKNKNNFKKINFYDLRMIIKIFGEEKGIYFQGKSHTNVVSLIKNFKTISIKDKLIDIFKKTNYEVNLNQIKDVFQKDSNAIDARLDELVDEMKIFKINPGTYINYEEGIKLCNKKKVILKISELLSKYQIVTNSFIRETLNDEFNYNHSIFYYTTLIKAISLEANWFHKEKFLSKEKFNHQEWDEKIKNLYDINLNINENYSKISKNLGISMLEVMNLRRELSENYKIN